MPDTKISTRDQIIQLLQQGKFHEALNCCDRELAVTPENDILLNNKAVALISLNRYEEALAHAKKAAAINPMSADTWVNIGVALDKLDRRQEATGALRRALKISPYNAYARALLGIIYQKLEMVECVEHHNRKLQELLFPREYTGFFFALASFLLGILLGGLHSAEGLSFAIRTVSEGILVLLFCGIGAIYLRSLHIWKETNHHPFAGSGTAAAGTGHHKSPYPVLCVLAAVFILGILSGILIWIYYHSIIAIPV
ncbi:tetratricopeptide repeat protein [Methanoregula sp.]|uniref:tetratricopeptide repeat protein n=1 Tax=Methanoregula sp. TaxID=2052170 RepID=UPI003569BD66